MTIKNKAKHTICVGQFAGAHGVRGLVKLRSFTEDPESIFAYKPLSDENGARVFKLTRKSAAKEFFIIAVEGIGSKEEADQLRGDKIYISRDLLPKLKKGEYFEGDLVGLHAFDKDGKNYGKVMGVFDYGAGVFLEIGTSKKDSFMLPFRDAFVPEVDLKAEKLLIVLAGNLN